MLRFFFSLVFYVLVGQWIYGEARLVAPSVVPLIDKGFKLISLPTHDRWDTFLSSVMGGSGLGAVTLKDEETSTWSRLIDSL